jgi:hypothetical protein
MTTLFIRLMNARTGRQVDRIVDETEVTDLQRIFLNKMANNAKRRIANVQREKKKSYNLQMN